MKTTSLLTLTFAGLLALVSALPQQEAAANDAYAEAWGYYGDKTVITGPTNVDEFGMPIAKRTGMPNAGGNGDGASGASSGNNDAWNAWGEHQGGNAGSGAPSWTGAGGNRPKVTGMPQGGSGSSSQGHRGED